MVGDNKILTVSYGTFSCTLEGFDDPLGAMREITEYFRDVSSEDRYFGAEPLTPDPEHVQLMAERRAAARLENRAAAAPAPAQTAAQPQTAAPAAAPVQNEIEDAEEASDEIPDEPAIAAEAPAPVYEPEEDDDFLEALSPVAQAPEPEPEPVAVAEAPAQPEPAPLAADTADHDDAAQDSAADRLARIRAAAGPELAPETIARDEVLEDDDFEAEPAMSASEPVAEPPLAAEAAPEPEIEPVQEPVPAEPQHAAPKPDYADVIARNVAQPPAAPEADADKAPQGTSVFEGSPIDNGNGSAERIFRDADTALEHSDARRRHSAIAHLKAAVSATVNDRNILGWRKKQNDEEEVAYRADLAHAVKPGVTADYEPRELPQELVDDEYDELSEPLVLGSDQRVDPNSLAALALGEDDRVLAEETRPVRPRASDEHFSDFAERVGARDLAELLEAAAAYSGQIEGRPQFSRPQIMKHVVAVTENEYSREDGLRSFGALLRQGKIRKLKRGLFVLSDNSRFSGRPRLAGE